MSDTPMKVCTKCGVAKEATPEFFHKHARCTYGVVSTCKQCRKEMSDKNRDQINERIRQRRKEDVEYRQKRSAYSREHRLRHPDSRQKEHAKNREINKLKKDEWLADRNSPTQCCTRCNIEYPNTTDYFEKSYKPSGVLRTVCRECRKVQDRQSSKTPNRIAYKRQYMAEYTQRPDAIASRKERSNRPDIKLKKHAYMSIYVDIRRARINASPEHFTAADLRLQYRSQRGLCWHCSIPLNNVYEADHLIPLAQGGTNAPDNICCSCKPCNRAKGSKTVAQWKGKLV